MEVLLLDFRIMAHTPWCGNDADKLYLQSGQFTSTLKTSEYVGGVDTLPSGVTYDGTNSPWIGEEGDKLYLTSGQFTSTLKTSESIGTIDVFPWGISWDGNHTPWTGGSDDKLYLQSGQFTSTLKTSELVSGIDLTPTGISYDGTNTPWSGFNGIKLYLQSGQFSSTVKTSQDVSGVDTNPRDVSWDGTNTPWTGATDSKLYLYSGQFTSTLKDSEDISAIDATPLGICTNDVTFRIGEVLSPYDTPWCGQGDDKLYLQSAQFTSTIKTSQDISSIDTKPRGVSWDGADTPWTGATDVKLYVQSGQFSSTVKTSQDVSGIDTFPVGISWDGNNTPWGGFTDTKLYLQSGQFSSTVKTSQDISSVDTSILDISWDGTNTPWSGGEADKLYLQSGQFTSTLKTSQDVSTVDTAPTGISWDGTNTLWSGWDGDKLYLTSGQFTSTLKDSEDISLIDGSITSIDTNDLTGRIGNIVYDRSIISTITFTLTITEKQNPVYLEALSAIAFTQLAKIPDIFLAATENTFDFTQTITRAGTEYVNAENTVGFIDQADSELNGTSIISRSILSVIDFTQTATDTVPFKLGVAESSITFIQTVLMIYPRRLSLNSTVEFLQFVDHTPKFLFAETDLSGYTYIPTAESEELIEVPNGFDQEVILTRNSSSPPSSHVNFEQSAGVVHIRAASGISKSATNTVTFTQEAMITYGSDSNVAFTQTATADLCKPCKSVVSFSQTVDLIANTTRGVSNSIEFEQSAYHTLTRNGVMCNTQNGVVPALPHYNNVQFSYPTESPTLTLTLRGPEFGNKERLHAQRINRETRGGTLVVYADPNWPKYDHIVLDFIGLTDTEANQTRTFIKSTLGKQVVLRDWEGRNWVGIITTPNNPVVRDGILCMNTLTLELEGYLGFDSGIISTVTFTQTAVATKV